MEVVILIVVVLALLVGYFLFGKKSGAEAPVPDRGREPTPKPTEDRRAPEGETGSVAEAEAAPDDESVAPEAAPSVAESVKPPTSYDVQGMRKGLARSRSSEGLFGRLRNLLGGKAEISDDLVTQIEEVLLTSDVGVDTTATILERLKNGLQRGDLDDSEKVWQALRGEALRILDVDGKSSGFVVTHKPSVVLLVGVNGAGKTTTIGKLATKLKAEGRECLLAAGDTFRPAAIKQLEVWGNRVGCQVVKGAEGGDPASVVFDAVKRGVEEGVDVILADTAGRLQTKVNLMQEMQKIARSAGKALDGAPHEVLLVLDATNGQNALAQAREFKSALPLTGVVLTKLDGTAKGGVVLGICDDLKLPVRFVGLGERPNDMHEFSATHFVEALLGKEVETTQ